MRLDRLGTPFGGQVLRINMQNPDRPAQFLCKILIKLPRMGEQTLHPVGVAF